MPTNNERTPLTLEEKRIWKNFVRTIAVLLLCGVLEVLYFSYNYETPKPKEEPIAAATKGENEGDEPGPRWADTLLNDYFNIRLKEIQAFGYDLRMFDDLTDNGLIDAGITLPPDAMNDEGVLLPEKLPENGALVVESPTGTLLLTAENADNLTILADQYKKLEVLLGRIAVQNKYSDEQNEDAKVSVFSMTMGVEELIRNMRVENLAVGMYDASSVNEIVAQVTDIVDRVEHTSFATPSDLGYLFIVEKFAKDYKDDMENNSTVITGETTQQEKELIELVEKVSLQIARLNKIHQERNIPTWRDLAAPEYRVNHDLLMPFFPTKGAGIFSGSTGPDESAEATIAKIIKPESPISAADLAAAEYRIGDSLKEIEMLSMRPTVIVVRQDYPLAIELTQDVQTTEQDDGGFTFHGPSLIQIGPTGPDTRGAFIENDLKSGIGEEF